jgi:hypothetical protein
MYPESKKPLITKTKKKTGPTYFSGGYHNTAGRDALVNHFFGTSSIFVKKIQQYHDLSSFLFLVNYEFVLRIEAYIYIAHFVIKNLLYSLRPNLFDPLAHFTQIKKNV